jgi:DNA-binding NtrC family response regulator
MEDHPSAPSSACDLVEAVEAFGRALMLRALGDAGWKKQRAAEALGLSPRALSHDLRRFDLGTARRDEHKAIEKPQSGSVERWMSTGWPTCATCT